MRWIIFAFALTVSSSADALDETFKFCAITGWFYGFGDNFTGDLAQAKINEPFNSACQAVWKDAYSRAQVFSKTSKAQDETDKQLVIEGAEFKSRIIKSILKGAGY